MAVINGVRLPKFSPTTTKIGKLSSVSLSPPPQLNVVNRRRNRGIVASITSSPSSSPLEVTSSGFPPSIKIPDITFYISRFCIKFFNNAYIASLIGDTTGIGKLHMLKIRMSIRDDDGVIADQFDSFYGEFADMVHKTENFDERNEVPQSLRHLAIRTCSYLLDYVDSWICGYSFILFVEPDVNFEFELDKLETVFNHYTNRSTTGATVRSAEVTLSIAVYGNICDRDIYSRDQLVDVLQQLSSLNPTLDRLEKDTILYVLPLIIPDRVSKEMVDQKEGYAHISLGKSTEKLS